MEQFCGTARSDAPKSNMAKSISLRVILLGNQRRTEAILVSFSETMHTCMGFHAPALDGLVPCGNWSCFLTSPVGLNKGLTNPSCPVGRFLFLFFWEGFPINLANQNEDALFSPGHWASEQPQEPEADANLPRGVPFQAAATHQARGLFCSD